MSTKVVITSARGGASAEARRIRIEKAQAGSTPQRSSPPVIRSNAAPVIAQSARPAPRRAYPDYQPMEFESEHSSVKLFGPKARPRMEPQRQAVAEQSAATSQASATSAKPFGNIAPSDVLIEQNPDIVPDALKKSPRPKTHAYDAAQPMDMGDVKLFGPKKAAPTQPARVIVRDDLLDLDEDRASTVSVAQPSYAAEEQEEETDAAVLRVRNLELE